MDKVDESNPAGAGGSDAEFVKQFGRGEIPATKVKHGEVSKNHE